MISNKKFIILPLILMIFILISLFLSLEDFLKKSINIFGASVLIKSRIQNYTQNKIPFSAIQNILHIPLFAILAFLWMKSFCKRKLKYKISILYTLAITFSFSIFSEFCQYFVVGRVASLTDLFLNLTGCLIGVGMYCLLVERKNSLIQ